jgi:hypothetical protein
LKYAQNTTIFSIFSATVCGVLSQLSVTVTKHLK